VTISAFDLFKIGVGPSSSHTVGPMRAACLFARRLDREGKLAATAAVRVELFGSLGATGHGHGTVKAVVAGLSGQMPDTVDPQHAQQVLTDTQQAGWRCWRRTRSTSTPTVMSSCTGGSGWSSTPTP
jgi:L-serine dehydratase